MDSILITKDWLKENAKRFSKICVPNYGKGYVRWVADEKIDFIQKLFVQNKRNNRFSL